MTIQGNEKSKVSKTVREIESGNFDDRSIDNLFMSLRAHAGSNEIFRELGDFVAHNDKREKGITNHALEQFYLLVRFQFEYLTPQKKIELAGPFPSWIKRLLLNQIKILPQKDLSKLKKSRKELRALFNKIYTLDESTDTVSFTGDIYPTKAIKLMNKLFSFMIVRPAYTQTEVMKQIFETLKLNNIEFDKLKLNQQAKQIALCILIKLHKTTYAIEGGGEATCTMSCTEPSIPLNISYEDLQGNAIEHTNSFGTLHLTGRVEIKLEDLHFISQFNIFETDLLAAEWCDEKLIEVTPCKFRENVKYASINFEQHLGRNDDFKLYAIAD
ncbi:hypothetical protein [Pseudomonas sp. CLCA07]